MCDVQIIETITSILRIIFNVWWLFQYEDILLPI